MRFVAVGDELRTGPVERDTLASCDLNLDTGLDGQVRGHDQVVVGGVDADRAVGEVPVGVSRDVSRNVRTLAFVRHDAVVRGTVRVARHEAVVVVVVRPERSDQTWASVAAAAVGQLGVVPGPETALVVGVAVVDEVHVTLTTDLDTVVAVVTVVGGTEVLELKASGDVHVGVALVAVGREVVPAVVHVRRTTGSAGQGRLSVGHFRQTEVKGLVAVRVAVGLDTVVRRGWLVTGIGVEVRSGRVLDARTDGTGLVHVTDRPRAVHSTAVGVVLVLNLVGHVVEQRLDGTLGTVGVVVRAVAPFHHEDLVGVTTGEVERRRGVAVGTGALGGHVLGREVVLHGVVDFEVLDVSRPGTLGELTVVGVRDALSVHQGGRPGTSGAAVGGHTVVHGGSDTGRLRGVQTGCWVTSVHDIHRHHTGARVGVAQRAVSELGCEGVGRWCNVADLVGHGARGGLATVVAGAEGEAGPAVGRGRTVDHVVGRRTSVVGAGSVEVVPAVGGHTHAVSGGGAAGGVEVELPEGASDVTWDVELVSLGVTVGNGGIHVGTARQHRIDAGLGAHTHVAPLVVGAVVEEDQVHAWAVLGADLQVAAVGAAQGLVAGGRTGVHAVAAGGDVVVPAGDPVSVEGGGARVETLLRAGATTRGVELKEVLIAVGVVRHLAVEEPLWGEVAAGVHVGGQGGHLLVASRCVGWVNDVEAVRRWRRLRTRQGRFVARVGARRRLRGGRQVLVFPIVLEFVTDGQVRRAGLEAAGGVGRTAGTDGDQLTSVKLAVGAQTVGRGTPGAAVVRRVVQGGCTGRRGVNTGQVVQFNEQRADAFNVRVKTGVGRELGGGCVGVRTAGVGDADVGVRRTRGGGVGVEVGAAVVVLTDTDGTQVGLSVGDVGNAAGGGVACGCGAAQRDGLPTGARGAHGTGRWGVADSGDHGAGVGTAVVVHHLACSEGVAVAGVLGDGVVVASVETALFHHDHVERHGGVAVGVGHVLAEVNAVDGGAAGEGVGGREGVLVPGDVVVGTVVPVVVAGGPGVTGRGVDVTVPARGRVHVDRGVNGQGEDAVFREEPVSVHHGQEEDVGAVGTDDEGPDVGLFGVGLNDHGRREFGKEFAGLHMSNLERFLGFDDFSTDHLLACVESIVNGELNLLAQTEVVDVLGEHGSLAQDHVLLDTGGFDRVVEVHAVSEGVANDVAANFDTVVSWCNVQHFGLVVGFHETDHGGVDTREDRVDPLVDLNSDTAGSLRSEGRREGVLRHGPAFGLSLNVQVDVRPHAVFRGVVKRFTGHDLREGAVLIEEGLGRFISHPLKFKRWVVFVICFSEFLGEGKVVILRCACFHKLNLSTGVVHVAAHWHEHHQCAQQQCNSDPAEDGLLFLILVSQHRSFTPYGLYAEHSTPYTTYISSGAKCLSAHRIPTKVNRNFV